MSSKFQDAMRRVITRDNAQGQSIIIIDGGPSSEKGSPDRGEMFKIWEDTRRSCNKRCFPDLKSNIQGGGGKKQGFVARYTAGQGW